MKTLFLPFLFIIFNLLPGSGNAQVPVYNSYPAASAIVYLDFDGHMVEGTSWNTNGPISCGPSNLNASQIQEIYNRVAEDYRPFNMNVTTDSSLYLLAPSNQRMRIILTITSEWYGAAGGVSFLGSFVWGDQTPAFVFTTLLKSNSKYIAEATSHEIGHTLGLRHQSSYDGNCIKTAEYNAGKGSGEIGWAPIMGVGYYRNFTLWNNGANPFGCTSYQDDLDIITTRNGFGYRNDDHNNEINSSATSINLTYNQFDASGVIENSTDKDVFSFNLLVPGHIHLDAIPYNIASGDIGSNLDVEVTLLNADKEVIGTYNPDIILSSAIDTALQLGTYYLSISGKGNVNAPEYASMGSYVLKGIFLPSAPLPIRKLELQGVTKNNKNSFNWIIEADEKVVKQELESSVTGYDYKSVAQLKENTRFYQNELIINSVTLFYRLHVSFSNGRHNYSNVISLKGMLSAKPFLEGNLVYQSLNVSSPSIYGYTILDYSGRIINKGKIVQGVNSIQTGRLAKGIYFIQFMNGQEIFTEKFMKR